MHVLMTGASGTVGRFILESLLSERHQITALGRHPLKGGATGFHEFDLNDRSLRLPEADILVHCALSHAPGRFRGGEGDDPEAFVAANVAGTARLFNAAAQAGCRTVFFLSSRAVYGDHRRGGILSESDSVKPDTLYGQVKRDGEMALQDLAGSGVRGFSLRATGVYGTPPGLTSHKWSALFEDAHAGKAVPSRKGTEVHGADVGGAVLCLLENIAGFGPGLHVFNVSDLMLDRRDLLLEWQRVAGGAVSLPERATETPGEMSTERLRALGWQPGGLPRLRQFLNETA